jgi:hypothetical protein
VQCQSDRGAAEVTTVAQQRPAGALSAVGSGNVEVPPGAGLDQGTRAARSARLFGDIMRRYGGAAGGSSAARSQESRPGCWDTCCQGRPAWSKV